MISQATGECGRQPGLELHPRYWPSIGPLAGSPPDGGAAGTKSGPRRARRAPRSARRARRPKSPPSVRSRPRRPATLSAFDSADGGERHQRQRRPRRSRRSATITRKSGSAIAAGKRVRRAARRSRLAARKAMIQPASEITSRTRPRHSAPRDREREHPDDGVVEPGHPASSPPCRAAGPGPSAAPAPSRRLRGWETGPARTRVRLPCAASV